MGTGGYLQRGRGRKGLSLGEQHLGSVSICIPIPTPDCRLLEVSMLNTWDLNPLQRLTQYNPKPMTKNQKRKVSKSPAPLPSIPPRRGSGGLCAISNRVKSTFKVSMEESKNGSQF